MKRFDGVLGSIRRAAETAFSRSTAHQPAARAMGLLHIMNNIALGLAFNVHDDDPMNPELFRYMGYDRKQGGDNQDALYLGVPVDASQTYRLYGNRGTAKYISLTTVERGSSPWGGGMGAGLFAQDLEVGPDGDFEVIFSATPHPENWLKLTPADFRVTIRQFFADWENERPMRARIERIGPPASPPLMTAERIMESLEATGQWIENTITFWQDTMDLFRRTPNQFVSWRSLTGDKLNATPGGEPSCGVWQVPEGMALVLRTRPPECQFWNIEFNNPWWETNDYRYRLTGTNMHHAALEDDGELIVVIAHEDPGIPNWLDTAGFTEGMMGRRWIFSDTSPEIECNLVRQDALFDHLPKNVKRMDAQQRAEQVAARRRGIYNRFNWM
ncbi:hypothetical protein MB02_12570 [Croceicoccus estronivorus]|nr:hypothetical protein MB02_12570 [Croceicoccus estronivorus]